MRIIFVCHGNICRSPAAEVIARQYIKENRLENIEVFSRALSDEEIGNDIYPPMKRTLLENGYTPEIHHAKRLTSKEVNEADIVYYMDESNKRIINYCFPNQLDKFQLITKYVGYTSIEDPWYTREFYLAYKEIKEAVEAIFENLK